MMKKYFVFLLLAFVSLQSCQAGDVITMDAKRLPAAAREFITRHFPDTKISYIKIESELLSKTYEVVLTDRTKIEFDGDGDWEEIDGKRKALPEVLVPDYVKQFVSQQYPEVFYTKLERDRGELEVRLSNRLSLTFNKKGDLIDIDD